MLAGERGRGVAREHRPVAVAELRPLTGRASVRVGLTDDDRLGSQLGKRRDASEPLIDGPQLRGDPHANMAVDERRRALRMKGDEVQRAARLTRRVVRAAETVLEKVLHEPAA